MTKTNITGLFDMHNHILFGVDDGARNIDESLRMLQIAYDDGIRSVLCTPHFHPKRGMAHFRDVKENFAQLQEAAAKHWNDLELYLGREVYFRHDVLEEEKDEKFLMAGTDIMLVEFSTSADENYIKHAVTDLLFAGYQPIIAHVERYACAVKNKNIVKDLRDLGAYIQINADSVLGKSGFAVKGAVKHFLKNGWVDFVSSDAHDINTRRPVLSECYAYVAKKYGEGYADTIFMENAKRVVMAEL